MATEYYNCPKPVFDDNSLKDIERRLYSLVLSYHHMNLKNGGDGRVYPSNSTLAKRFGVDRRTIQRAFNTLEKRQYIRKVTENGQRLVYPLVPLDGGGNSVTPHDSAVTGVGQTCHPSYDNSVTQDIVTKIDKKDILQQRFDQFWKAYPKRVEKQKAQKSWKKLRMTDGLFAQIMAALEQQKQSREWQKDSGQFIPNPAKWLNDARWEDEITVSEPRTRQNKIFGNDL